MRRMRHYTAHRCLLHSIGQTITWLIERFRLFRLFLRQLFWLSLSYLMLFIFSWGEICSEFFLSLSKLSIFWWWLKVTSKNWFEKPKTKARKSQSFSPIFLVAHCSTKVGIFICSENQKSMGGHGDAWFIGSQRSHAKLIPHSVWSVWIIQNNYTNYVISTWTKPQSCGLVFVTDIYYFDSN